MTTSVYILESNKNGRYYIGSAKDVNKRFVQHNSGKVAATKKFRPHELVFQQEYPDLRTARKIENRLKRFKRRDFITQIISDGEIKISGH